MMVDSGSSWLELFWKVVPWIYLLALVAGLVLSAIRARHAGGIFILLFFAVESLVAFVHRVYPTQTGGPGTIDFFYQYLSPMLFVIELLAVGVLIVGVHLALAPSPPAAAAVQTAAPARPGDQVRWCPKCGRPARPDDEFCVQCGTKF